MFHPSPVGGTVGSLANLFILILQTLWPTWGDYVAPRPGGEKGSASRSDFGSGEPFEGEFAEVVGKAPVP